MIDTIVCDKQSGQVGIALLGDGEVKEIEFAHEDSATEGSIYLGRITRKLELAHDKVGFMVDIAGERDAFMMAEEFGLQDSNFHEGQSRKRSEVGSFDPVGGRLCGLLSVSYGCERVFAD